ncbi:MAG TPA: hotdog domain-containing protein, partial [Anaeromyxobacter sp.]|nr:hotdog domain-containing protein [Anaeromyxobacter sp.]
PVRAEDTSRETTLPFSSDAALRRRFAVLNEAIPGNIRFGMLLEVLDRIAADAALEYARRARPDARVVTAALDEIVVRSVADVSRDLRCAARINHVGRTSMEVGVRVDRDGGAEHVASCYFTMVARDGDGPEARSVAVPPLEPGDLLARARTARALERRAGYRREADAAVEPPSREEYLWLARLHRAQEAPTFSGALASALAAESWERTYPEQENLSKVIFGGYIMRRAHELSSICAEQIAPGRPVIAAVNRINFFEPVRIGDKLHLTSRVVHTEGPAICVETSIERVSRDRSVRALSNSCLFTFVNVDAALAPRDVPGVHPTTYAEDARALAARRNLRSLLEHTTKGWLARALAPARG